MNMYAQFQKELYGREVREFEHGFVTYSRMKDGSVYMHGLYVVPEKRRTNLATKMVDTVVRETDTKYIASYVDLTTLNPELSIAAHLGYGMKILESSQTSMIFGKEIK